MAAFITLESLTVGTMVKTKAGHTVEILGEPWISCGEYIVDVRHKQAWGPDSPTLEWTELKSNIVEIVQIA